MPKGIIHIPKHFKGVSTPVYPQKPEDSSASAANGALFTTNLSHKVSNIQSTKSANGSSSKKNVSAKNLSREDLNSLAQQVNGSYEKLKAEYEKDKKHQGVFGKFANWGKNRLGVSPEGKSNLNPVKWWGKFFINSDNGSKAAEKDLAVLGKEIATLNKYAKEGKKEEFLKKYQEITGQKDINLKFDLKKDKVEPKNMLDKNKYAQKAKSYADAQRDSVDALSDYAAWFGADAAYTAAAAGLAAAPFTGGASLLVTGGAMLASVGAGAATKSLIKYTDARTGNNKYNSLKSDLAVGGFVGAISPVSSFAASKITGAVTRGIGGKVVAENMGTSMTRDIEISGVNKMTKFGLESLQSSLDWGFFDGSQSAFMNTYETGSLKGSGKAFTEAFVNAAVMGPVFDKSVAGLGKSAKLIKLRGH